MAPSSHVIKRVFRCAQSHTGRLLRDYPRRPFSTAVAHFYRFRDYETLPKLHKDTKTFKSSELQIVYADPKSLKRKPDESELAFGKWFTDHMLEVEWEEDTGWGKPLICPLHELSIHPAAKVLHYAIEVFEGMKACYGVDGKVRLFRPELNIKRLLKGARRSCLPKFESEEFLSCLKELIRVEQAWIPRSETSNLYLRPTFIGTHPSLGVSRSLRAKLFTIMCPIGSYFGTSKLQPIGLLADPRYVRSWPGGCGDLKVGSNYGPTAYAQRHAEIAGLQQVLWLYGDDQWLTEVGQMNIFLFVKDNQGRKELITPPLQGLILPGVTRQSILELCREWDEFRITERFMSMKELIQLCQEKRLLEFFGSGTASIVCPVDRISYLGVDYRIPTVEHADPLCSRLFKQLSDIYYGRVAHEWSIVVNE